MRCCAMSSIVTPPDSAPEAVTGAALHWRALESLYASAPVNRLFESQLEVTGEGLSRIRFRVEPRHYHAAGAAHGTIYFKMLDDAAFYAANTLVTDRFLLTTSFNLHFSRPVKKGDIVAEGRWISGRRRVLVAEARLLDHEGEEIGRGTGTFMRSHIALSSLPGYAEALRPPA
jgi:uncharacterized protein (TIGR00369 family)